jgi:glucose-6-phosphate-specific signal transduction histidine kinase
MIHRLLAPVTYVIALAAFCIAAYAKLSGSLIHPLIPSLSCFVSQAVFSSIGIYEISRSTQLLPAEKRNWRLYLFFLPLVFGFFYLGWIRKKAIVAGIEAI